MSSALANKLKVNLKLSVNRIKMSTAKQDSIQNNYRREIADLLRAGKEESAKIKVEHIIGQDYNREAMEVLELLCELLLARFTLLIEQKQCDPSLLEAVHTVIYASSRSDIKEMLSVRELLGRKFGKEFVEAASVNKYGLVNQRVLQRLHVSIPDPSIVTAYLVEIAKKYNVSYSPPSSGSDGSKGGSGGEQVLATTLQQPLHQMPVPVLLNPQEINSRLTSTPPQQQQLVMKQSPSIPELPISPPRISASMTLANTTIEELPAPAYDKLPEEPNFDDLARRFEQLKNKR